MKIIDTFDIILIAWLCFLYFKDVTLFSRQIFFVLFTAQVVFQAISEGLIQGMKKAREKNDNKRNINRM